MLFTPQALHSEALGQRSRGAAKRHPGSRFTSQHHTLKAFHMSRSRRPILWNAFGVRNSLYHRPLGAPRDAATQGFGIQPLRGKE